MIHTHIKRLKYVENYLCQSLENQGINENDIYIVLDDKNNGNLQSFIYSLKCIINTKVLAEEKGIWHLQDDVIISKDFKKKCETYAKKDCLINGFVSSNYNKKKLKLTGKQEIKNSWLSMPCIYIPNKYVKEFLNWLDNVKNSDFNDYKQKYKQNRHDDFFLLMYLEELHKNDFVYNLKPNLVDHIDFLIGNSINKPRKDWVRGYYFEDLDLVEKLEREIKNDADFN